MRARAGRPSPSQKSRVRISALVALLLAAFLFATLSSTYTRAQKQSDDDDVVRVESDLVVINVTVTVKQGHYVHKLARPQFKVFEDGREQPVSLFSVEATPFAAAILLDTLASMETRLTLARAAAIRFLEGMREEDVVSVYNFYSEV